MMIWKVNNYQNVLMIFDFLTNQTGNLIKLVPFKTTDQTNV